MDNQDSNPQIIVPNVPDDFCPSGDWRSVFQTFIDTVLINGTVNIPDLSDISPAAITQLQTDVTNLQTDVSAAQADITNLENRPVVTVKSNQTAVSNTDAQYSVTFPSAMPSATYSVALTPLATTATNPTAIVYLVAGTKTVNGFSFMVEAASSNTTHVEWTAIHTT